MNALSLGVSYDHALSRLEAAGGDMAALPEVPQTLLLVEAAQSIIDSGGLAYFYETDFPHNPPYALFADAYRRIGAEVAAECIEASSLLFPFAEPHFFEPLRQLWLEKLALEPGGTLEVLSRRIAGDDSVWERLRAYVAAHRAEFKA